MKDWKTVDEPVEMVEQRFSFFPSLFRWHGRCYDVHSVERCWTTAFGRRENRSGRRYFRVVCADTTFDLYQDLQSGTWHLHRALILPAAAPVLRRAAVAWR